jgi:DNA-binding MarR family transcriptional regulator/predicted N-acetyltransferase YhbS
MGRHALRRSEQSLVPTFRRFNRFYTALIGTLSRGYLETPYSLQEARVIFEVATNPGCTAKDIQLHVGFDQGYLSRLVERLTRARLIRRTKSADDGRAQNLFLTSSGKTAFTILNERADGQARQLTTHLNDNQVIELRNALRVVHRLLDSEVPSERINIREQQVGDLGWAFYRQAAVYKDEFGYSQVFESHVCEGLFPYLKNYEPKRDRMWVGVAGDQTVGSITVHHVTDRPGWAQLRWFFVEKSFRGRGLGSRLLEGAVSFCKKAGYEGVFLWTVSDLDAARRVYQKAGFKLAEEKEECDWASWAREQRWELRLGQAALRHRNAATNKKKVISEKGKAEAKLSQASSF